MKTVDLRLGRYQDVLADVTCDAVIVDAPFSAKTHDGHDAGCTVPDMRNTIVYSAWSSENVREFCEFWRDRCRGWFVSITDHNLAPVWAAEFERIGLYTFAPLPWVAPGSRVRLAGDGPSSWTCWVIVARPKRAPFSKWGTLPGAYIVNSERDSHIGGKPTALMRALVRDYSRPGDVVCDPCSGGGTTLLAAAQEGRIGIGAEMDPETHAKATARLDKWLAADFAQPQLLDYKPAKLDLR